MRFPSIADVRSVLAAAQRGLRRINRNDLCDDDDGSGPATDVRLQVWSDGTWQIHTGDSSYDQDHRGARGSSCLLWDRQNLTELARDLIEQAKDQHACMDEYRRI